jgi:hypothetical protein
MNQTNDPSVEFSEEWLPVVGWEGYYEVSNLGRARSVPRLSSHGHWITGTILRQQINPRGYFTVHLSKDNRTRTLRVHLLVAYAFIGPRPLGKSLDHVDGNKLNNHAANLEYVTHLENCQRAMALGNWHRLPPGEDNPSSKLSDAQVNEIRRLHTEGITQRKLSVLFKISNQHVSRIVNLKRRSKPSPKENL